MEQAPRSLIRAARTNLHCQDRAYKLNDAFRKLALLFRRYAQVATGPRNLPSVALNLLHPVATNLILSATSPEGPLEVVESDAMFLLSEGCDSDFPVTRSVGSIRPPQLHEYVTS